jgi:hypothetical protein
MMKMLQKILSHGLLIAVIVAAFFMYTNRAELLPGWFGEDKSATAQPGQGAGDTVASSSEPVAKILPKTVVEEAGLSAEEVAAIPNEQQAPVTGLQSPEGAGQSTAAETGSAGSPGAPVYRPLENEAVAPTQVAAEKPGQGAGAAQDSNQPQVEQVADSGVLDQQPAPVEEAAPAQATSVAALDTAGNEADGRKVQQKLEAARQLYWQRDVGAAPEAYEALGREYPNDANIWGEIGNFYYSVQQTESAGTAYYRTVSLLIDKGDTQKARQLLGVLYELDANRGRELDARLQQTVE